eukprot:TRINITY_DN5956_c0_g1_i1.p1 TRINITY_DN5956_c0_g1~~TRINITY_DN5956_c0_g1_i1.p1  ORF type:complete len:840 (+),score=117.75 TRINITY_DN5956_c0_g1_i1:135-2654(+)
MMILNILYALSITLYYGESQYNVLSMNNHPYFLYGMTIGFTIVYHYTYSIILFISLFYLMVRYAFQFYRHFLKVWDFIVSFMDDEFFEINTLEHYDEVIRICNEFFRFVEKEIDIMRLKIINRLGCDTQDKMDHLESILLELDFFTFGLSIWGIEFLSIFVILALIVILLVVILVATFSKAFMSYSNSLKENISDEDFFQYTTAHIFFKKTEKKFIVFLVLLSFGLLFVLFGSELSSFEKDLFFLCSLGLYLVMSRNSISPAINVMVFTSCIFFVPWLYLFLLLIIIMIDEVRPDNLFYKYKTYRDIHNKFKETEEMIFSSIGISLLSVIVKIVQYCLDVPRIIIIAHEGKAALETSFPKYQSITTLFVFFLPYFCWIFPDLRIPIYVLTGILLTLYLLRKQLNYHKYNMKMEVYLSVLLLSVGIESFLFATILGEEANIGRNICWIWIIFIKMLLVTVSFLLGLFIYLFLFPDLHSRQYILGNWCSKNNTGVVTLNVSRDNIVQGTLEFLKNQNVLTPTSIVFINESGVDAGGIFDEWINVFSTSILSEELGFFEPGDEYTYFIGYECLLNPNFDEDTFVSMGKFFGKVLSSGRSCGINLGTSVFKFLLGKEIQFTDLEEYDHTLYKTLINMENFNDSDFEDCEITFSVESFHHEVVPLKRGGTEEYVTKETFHEFRTLWTRYLLVDRVWYQLNQLKLGFESLVPKYIVAEVSESDLQKMLCGDIQISVEDWKKHTLYSQCHPNEADIKWFWEILESFKQDELKSLFSAVCGSSNPPFGGFSKLNTPFQINRSMADPGSIPSTHTCFNTLDLPLYSSREQAEEKLRLLVENNQGFGFG